MTEHRWSEETKDSLIHFQENGSIQGYSFVEKKWLILRRADERYDLDDEKMKRDAVSRMIQGI